VATIIDDNHLEAIARIHEPLNGLQAKDKLFGSVIGWNDDGKERGF
jgi:hypothetical protein